MSSSTVSIPSLCIIYAVDRCTTDQVAEVFNYIIDDNQVETVTCVPKTNSDGRPFKLFFINFARESTKLTEVVERIKEEQSIRVLYDDPWYWKVALSKRSNDKSNTDSKSTPRIMERK